MMTKTIQKTFRGLGTVNTITIPTDNSTALLEAERRVLELDDRLSVFKEDSDISRINRAAGRECVRVHSDTLDIIRASLQVAERSEGAFDITARPLVDLWGIGKKKTQIPSPRDISCVRELVDYRDIALNEISGTVMLRRPGQALDLGGVAKGYAADEVRRILLDNGVTDALINLGGTVIAMGASRTIGIQNPQKNTGVPMGRVQVTDCSLVTSGSYEQYFIRDGVRYHHLIDPRTGVPAQSGLLGVTLIGNSAMELDALSTAVFILGMERGLRLLEPQGIQAVFVTDSLDVFATPGLKDNFSILDK